jgi:hypothetical protein
MSEPEGFQSRWTRLAPGVPPDLTRAALRRAWVADPKIHDFIGIAENQGDFTAVDAMPGFGPLGSPDDVRRWPHSPALLTRSATGRYLLPIEN